MLKHLHIENYAIIEHLDIDFARGLNIITGETGAGKSILLGALGLLSGARADSAAIAQNSDKCIVEGIFSLVGYGLEPLFEELDLDFSDEIAIRRVVMNSGKSRAFIGDLPVTLATLKTISDRLIDIHSQHQTLLISRGDFQREILDAVAGTSDILYIYRESFKNYLSAKREVEALRSAQREAAAQSDYIAFQVEQLQGANLREGEMAELEERQTLLSSAEELTATYGESSLRLVGEDGAVADTLRSIRTSLEKIEDSHKAAGELAERVNSCYIELKDIGEELSDLALSIEADPRELESIDLRLDILYTLCKKHNVQSSDELIPILREFEKQLSSVENGEENIAEAEKKVVQLLEKATQNAQKLTQKRQKVVPKIEKFIAGSLLQLGIKHPRFAIEIKECDLKDDGADEIEFLFSGNEKSALQPIGSVASGGEMSRVMLSIKYLVARQIQLPTIIFDEIDTGVSGAVADAIGGIIESMSSDMQVMNITHLPQVAAKGSDHFEVYKDKGTHIRKLTESERVERIAAMLSGATVTDAARKQAEELLKRN